MKKFGILLGCLILTASSYGQKKMKVSEGKESIGNGNNNALSIVIYVSDESLVEKNWTKELKDMKGKVSSKKEIFADDCQHKAMGENTFDVWSKVSKEGEDAVRVIMAVDLGGAFLSSAEHGEKYKSMKDLLYNFGVDVTKEFIGNELKDQEKVLKNLQGELQDLVKDKESLTKSIEDYKKKISEAEAEIVANDKNQVTKTATITTQEEVIKGVEAKLKAVN